MRSGTRWIVMMAVGFGLMLAPVPAFALDPAPKCEAGKLKAVGKYANCRLRAESKAVKKGLPPDYSKCVEKLSGVWTTLEAKGAGQCTTNGDYVEVEAATTVFSDYAEQCLDGTCPPIMLPCIGSDPTVCLLKVASDAGAWSPCGQCVHYSCSHLDCGDFAGFSECNSIAWTSSCREDCCGVPY